jgi:hypothetical protein
MAADDTTDLFAESGSITIFLACALEAEAYYILSGDKHLTVSRHQGYQSEGIRGEDQEEIKPKIEPFPLPQKGSENPPSFPGCPRRAIPN